MAFSANLRPGDAWRQRPELHLAAVKACVVPTRSRGAGKYDSAQFAKVDLVTSRVARFALATSLVASCHPYCVPSTDPFAGAVDDDGVSTNPFGKVIVDDANLWKAEPVSSCEVQNQADWTSGSSAGQWRWIVARFGGRTAVEALLQGDGATSNSAADSESSSPATLLNDIESLLLGNGKGWLWSDDDGLRAMAQLALRGCLRLPGIGDALAVSAARAAISAMDSKNSGYVAC